MNSGTVTPPFLPFYIHNFAHKEQILLTDCNFPAQMCLCLLILFKVQKGFLMHVLGDKETE